MSVKQIIAMGGYPEDRKNVLLDRYILAQSPKPRPRICFVPTASGDSAEYVERYYSRYRTFDCVPSHLSVFAGPVGDWRDYLLSNDVILVGGGNTRNMLTLWREWKIDKIMREAWEMGIVLAGVSAGAICWFEQGVTDSIPGDLTPLACLGFLKGSNCPHFDGEPMRRPSYHRLLATGQIIPGIACDDAAAAHFVDGTLHRIVCSVPTAKAYRLALNGTTVVETPMPGDYLG